MTRVAGARPAARRADSPDAPVLQDEPRMGCGSRPVQLQEGGVFEDQGHARLVIYAET